MEPLALFRNLNMHDGGGYRVAMPRILLSLFLIAAISACSSSGGKYPIGHQFTPEENVDVAKVGKPYSVKGEWYYPQVDLKYSQTGMASWYGEDFHRKGTANGETFDKYAMTAAHRTLPMPCMARVTNLQNGKSVVVRVNDRGPFAAGRIIDVSHHAAERLGFLNQGIAKVQVDYLPEETALLFPPGQNPYEGRRTSYTSIASANQPSSLIPDANATEVARALNAPSEPVQIADLSPQSAALQKTAPMQNSPSPFKVGKSFSDNHPANVKFANDKGRKKSYYIQAGSYRQQSKAEAAAEQLGREGKAEIIPAAFNGVQFYRLRLGPLASSKAADQKLDAIVNYGFKDAFVISD